MSNRARLPLSALAALILLASTSAAQDTTKTKPDTTKAPAPATTSIPIDFSGILFLNYQSGGTKTERRVSQQNRFDVDRIYLTFRMPAGENTSIRVTTDVYQQRDSTRDQYYRGWAIRAKYAWGQYDYIRGTGPALRAVARLGLITTPVVDYEESFWIRGLSQVALDQNGYMSSADVGASTLVTLPNRWGEAYVGVWNGSAFTSRETDRFKDYGGRVTFTPIQGWQSAARTISITPWAYHGFRGSDFVRGRGSVRPVTDGLQKDRFGVLLAARDPRFVFGTELAMRMDQAETVADTITTTVPTRTDVTGRLLSSYVVLKPLALLGAGPSSWNVVFRYDHIKPNVDTPANHDFIIAGIGYDLSRRASLWLDYQNQDPKDGSTAADVKTLFVQAIVSF
jgi:hypothetical protein